MKDPMPATMKTASLTAVPMMTVRTKNSMPGIPTMKAPMMRTPMAMTQMKIPMAIMPEIPMMMTSTMSPIMTTATY